MLTKSLHTVTAVTNVALHLMHTTPVSDAVQLTRKALAVLGYDMGSYGAKDDTVQRCIASVTKLLTEQQAPAAAPRRARQYFDEHGRRIKAVYTADGQPVSLTSLR